MEGLVKIDINEALELLLDSKLADRVYFYLEDEKAYERVTDYKWVFGRDSAWNQLHKVYLFKVGVLND